MLQGADITMVHVADMLKRQEDEIDAKRQLKVQQSGAIADPAAAFAVYGQQMLPMPQPPWAIPLPPQAPAALAAQQYMAPLAHQQKAWAHAAVVAAAAGGHFLPPGAQAVQQQQRLCTRYCTDCSQQELDGRGCPKPLHSDLIGFQSRNRDGRNKPGKSLLWIPDSGTTAHICNDVIATMSRIRPAAGWFVPCDASRRHWHRRCTVQPAQWPAAVARITPGAVHVHQFAVHQHAGSSRFQRNVSRWMLCAALRH
jgi:hypothetical protein